jgi:dTDP-4-amino-4,6-dideoxygalactose transaminase
MQTPRRLRLSAPLSFKHPVYVTRPLLPPLKAYTALLKGIWNRRWLSNKGQLHDALEKALCNYLRVENLSLVSSGTIALSLACHAFDVSGEVITTPFTSPATVNALTWCNLTPVFADIDPVTLTLDPDAVESAITPRTTAIVGVHIYGMPCKVDLLQIIANRHDLRVIYDGAHTFGTEIDSKSILTFGDATTLSFHATKLFTTAEGGAIVVHDRKFKQRIDLLKNLGIRDEVTVSLPGINAKMNEFEAALGIANLEVVEAERLARAEISEIYRMRLSTIDGLSCFEIPPHIRKSHLYFVVRIEDGVSRISRDDLYESLKAFNVFARRYFYPLCSEFPFYRSFPSSEPRNLKVANRIAKEVLCLPLYGELGTTAAHRICDIIEYILSQHLSPRPLH